jgi:Leu/Phe-tRNA-protein transferase
MTKLQEKDERQHPRREPLAIEEYIPLYLRRFITPYHGDFCVTRVFHFKLVAQLMSEGFLPIATDGVLLPKLHANRCVITLPNDLHVSKSVRKKSKRFNITVNKAFDNVVEGCKKQHGRRCWLYPPLVEAFKTMNDAGKVQCMVSEDGGNASERECPVRLYSIEVWNESSGELAGGELGYSVGSIYTSLTGFSSEESAGSVQLAALGRMLCSLGFSIWDLGMQMEYKDSLGSHLMPRKQFVEHVHDVRERKGNTVLPAHAESFNAKSLIDQTISAEKLLSGNRADSNDSNKPPESKNQNGNHEPPFDQDDSATRDRKKLKNSKPVASQPKERTH